MIKYFIRGFRTVILIIIGVGSCFLTALAVPTLRNPITPPEPPLPVAYQRAIQALGTETNTFYCIEGNSMSLSGNLGSTEWHFEFWSTNGQIRSVIVGSNGKTIVRNP